MLATAGSLVGRGSSPGKSRLDARPWPPNPLHFPRFPLYPLLSQSPCSSHTRSCTHAYAGTYTSVQAPLHSLSRCSCPCHSLGAPHLCACALCKSDKHAEENYVIASSAHQNYMCPSLHMVGKLTDEILSIGQHK